MTKYIKALIVLLFSYFLIIQPSLSYMLVPNNEITISLRFPKEGEDAKKIFFEKLTINGNEVKSDIPNTLSKLDFQNKKFTIKFPINAMELNGELLCKLKGKPASLSRPFKDGLSQLKIKDNSVITDTITIDNLKAIFQEDTNDLESLDNVESITFRISCNSADGGKLDREIEIGAKRTITPQPEETMDEPPVEEPDFTKEAYYKAIKTIDSDFIAYQLSNNADTIYAYFDSEMQLIKGVILPNCNSPNSFYRFFVLGKKEDGKKYELNIETEEFVTADFIVNGGKPKFTSVTEPQILCQALVGPVAAGVRMKINFLIGGVVKQVKSYKIPSCNDGYHVSIMAGFYRSESSNPTNIRPATINGVNTLIADNPEDQLAFVISAVFYLKPRPFYYEYKSLDFWNKWSMALGTKLGPNLFDDLFLGVNYEFAKGGSFNTGIHYGQHTVINGYDDFEFGKTPFSSPNNQFNAASDVHRRWDVALYFGVNIDLRVLGAFKGANDSN